MLLEQCNTINLINQGFGYKISSLKNSRNRYILPMALMAAQGLGAGAAATGAAAGSGALLGAAGIQAAGAVG